MRISSDEQINLRYVKSAYKAPQNNNHPELHSIGSLEFGLGKKSGLTSLWCRGGDFPCRSVETPNKLAKKISKNQIMIGFCSLAGVLLVQQVSTSNSLLKIQEKSHSFWKKNEICNF